MRWANTILSLVITIAIAIVATTWDASGQTVATPARDAARSSRPVGTAMLSGVILADGTENRPLRRVRVSIRSSDSKLSRTEITTDDGRFTFSALPAGRYTLEAMKAGYVGLLYGARRPNRPGSALVLGNGEGLTNIVMRLPRTSVIAGMVVDQNGDPFPGVTVSVMRRAFDGTGRRVLRLVGASMQTDDQGRYRSWGFGAGEYIVYGFMRLSGAPAMKDLLLMAEANAPPARRTLSYAPVYFSGAFTPSQATPITIGTGEERTDVDLRLPLVRTATVQVAVVIPDSVERNSVSVRLRDATAEGDAEASFFRAVAGNDGTYTCFAVPPGQYRVIARGVAALSSYWALGDVTVDGEDVSGVTLTLQPTLKISGRVQLDAAASPADLSRIRLIVRPVGPVADVNFEGLWSSVEANGRFSIGGILPGRYELHAIRLAAGGSLLHVKSATIAGRTGDDRPIDIRESVDSVVVTLTNRAAELSGILSTSDGAPATEDQVAVFTSDRAFWGFATDRIQSVRPGADGKYIVPALPPGEYLLAAISDLETNDLLDPAVLERLSKGAVTISVAEGEKVTRDLRIEKAR